MNYLSFALLFFWSFQIVAADEDVQRLVWVNEAIVQTYTYSYQGLVARQKHIATYFSASGWIAYTKALEQAKLLDAVIKNHYAVSAVATMPPTLQTLSPTSWRAQMPVLVIYQNPEYIQKQTLNVTLDFGVAAAGQGVRGYVINQLRTKEIAPPCVCKEP